ncbi:hypothetical protein RHAB15C_0001072 [Candidatus Rhabdochlamydia porcellionis]|uniref:Uncharacterized protein n=1 Tax=Candidatus Rhabdochlamydia porcellionis TaxID=225148 RepID=A0ABX8Z0L2_9BACT|nr:hypothetical protein RHAB15C_0001072 [Candidatus Rhabdochlamydia porcellionis]
MLWFSLAGLAFCFFQKKYPSLKKETFLMEALLQSMIFEQDFGYTLFGNKPVSLAGYFLNPSFNTIFFSKRGSLFPIVEAWSLLEKNVLCHLQGNYILLKQVDHTKNCSTFQVIIINKSSFLQTVTEHLDLFCELLEKKIDPKELLDEVILNQKSLWYILKGNQVLYGIILGYGKKNSLAFKRKWELGQVFNDNYQNLLSNPPFYPKPSKGFSSSEDEYRYFEEQHDFFDIRTSPLSPLIPPCFMIMKDIDTETKLLAKKYKETFKQIIEIYAKGDFLSITLDHLMRKKGFHIEQNS